MSTQKELIKRIWWSFCLLLVFEIGKNIAVPIFTATDTTEKSSSLVLRFLSTSTGGNFNTPTLFSLGMGPYMTALIIWTTLSMIDIDSINNLSKKQVGYIQRLLTLIFALLQSVALVLKFRRSMDTEFLSGEQLVLGFSIGVIILTAGGLFLSWLADLNITRGIGGQSLFILPGLMANLPAMLISGQQGSVTLSFTYLLALVFITVLFIYMTLMLYNAEYRIKIERTGIDSRYNNSYIPIRLLPAGAMPFMFAVTVFSLPQLVLLNDNWKNTGFSNFIATYFSFNSIEGVLMYGLVLYGLGWGFSFINVRPHDIAKHLKEAGDYVLNVPPGDQTENYVRRRLSGVAFVGNSYLVIVSMIPLLMGLNQPLISNLAFYFGSLFMLIIILDNLTQEVRFIYSKKSYNIFQ